MIVHQTPRFEKAVKKLHKNQKSDLYDAVRTIMSNPHVGNVKKGDLAGVQVYTFKMVKQETLLAYICDGHTITLTLLVFGSHENFYNNVKRYITSD